MVRKIIIMIAAVVLISATLGATTLAATHNVYENGSLSSTYITYFKDILSGSKFTDNYVAFRSGQNAYTLIVGKLEYNNGEIKSVDKVKEYIYSTESSNYNAQYKYNVNTLNSFSVNTADNIIYSDVGDFPQLIERGAKYEMLNSVLLIIIMLCFVISRILRPR